MTFSDNVYTLCRKIPAGKVTTYKALADALGTGAYRAIGQVLRRNPHAPEVPCHRVVKSTGDVGGFFGSNDNAAKIALLEKEMVAIVDGKVDLARFFYAVGFGK